MNFVIVSLPRTGTSMLVNALDSLEGFNVYGELFATGGQEYFEIIHPQQVQQQMLERRVREGFYNKKGKSCSAYLDNIFSKQGNVGFKLLYPHVKKLPELINEINKRDVHKILMYRTNMLKRVVSGFTNRRELPIVLDPSVALDAIVRSKKEEGQLFRWFSKGKHMKISYEELTEGKDALELNLSRVWNFLGVDMPSIVESPLRKYASPLIEDRLENYKEFRAYFEKHASHLLRFFDET